MRGAPAARTLRRQSYEAAIARLDEIIARLDSGQAELRETLGLVREGKSLVEFCKGELDAVSGELEKLDLDKLVEAARVERQRSRRVALDRRAKLRGAFIQSD